MHLLIDSFINIIYSFIDIMLFYHCSADRRIHLLIDSFINIIYSFIDIMLFYHCSADRRMLCTGTDRYSVNPRLHPLS